MVKIVYNIFFLSGVIDVVRRFAIEVQQYVSTFCLLFDGKTEQNNFENMMDDNTTISKSQNDTELLVDNNVYVISAFFHFIASVASILGNVLVITSVIKFRSLRETAHTLVVLLACFDLVIGVTGLVEQCMLLLNVYKGKLDGMRTFCLILGVIMNGMSNGDLLSVVFMAIDRFIYITYPLRYKVIVTPYKMTLIVVFIVFYSPVTSVISALMSEPIEGQIVCNLNQIGSEFSNYLFMVEGVVLDLVFTLFYGQVAYLACRKARQVHQENTHNSTLAENSVLQPQSKVTRVLSLVIGVYFVTTVCYGVVYILFSDTVSSAAVIMQLSAEWIWKVGILDFRPYFY